MRLSFKNKATPENIRVKIVAKSNSSIKIIGDVTAPGNNPTMVLNDGELVFCLAPVITQGVWSLNPEFNITEGIVTYSAYKNIRSTKYFSHANMSLLEPVIRSFQNEGMQQWKAVKDATNELTGTTVWVFDTTNKIVTYDDQGPRYITFQEVSQKIIDNSLSTDVDVSNTATLYLEEVSNSIYGLIQFITKDELLTTFEDNIVRVSYKGVEQEHIKITANTTSALDFEKGLVDRLPGVTWELSGSNTIQDKNTIFSEYSIETKSLGDGIFTASSVITGGNTPFTVEYYFLYKGKNTPNNNEWDAPIFTKYDGADQGNYLNTKTYNISFYKSISSGGTSASENQNLVFGKTKLMPNTINKVTMTYDSSALRIFINDRLDNVLGSNGLSTNNKPIRFLSRFDDINSTNKVSTTFGLIDNINIYDGVATKVRDTDPFEGNLIVDLACEGEHNSTRLVDNGLNKNKWTISGSSSLSTSKPFSGYSSLYIPISSHVKSTDPLPIVDGESFTISFSFNIDNWNGSLFNGMVSNIRSGSQQANRFQICYTRYNNINSIVVGYVDETGVDSIINTVVQGNLLVNTEYKLDLIFQQDKLDIYLNNVLNNSSFITGDNQFGKIFDQGLILGGFAWNLDMANGLNGYIKNFKIYKGISVIPESRSGKVQLNFDKNVLDDYKNSTWTSYNVTYDDVNSVKGSSIKFAGSYSSHIETAANTNFNYGTSNYSVSMDYKRVSQSQPFGHGFFSNGYTSNQDSVDRCAFVCSNGSPTNPVYSINGSNTTCSMTGMSLDNVYYKFEQHRIGGVIVAKANGVIGGVVNVGNTGYNWNYNNKTTLGKANYESTLNYNGYLDNFKSIKNSTEKVIIDKPAVHLPFETNSNNIGSTALTINAIGSPTYSVVDSKKCVKFENGKYLTVNSNNIFNLGASSDFYIELDFFLETFKSEGYGHTIMSNNITSGNGIWLQVYPNNNTQYGDLIKKVSIDMVGKGSIINSTNEALLGSWNNLKLYRTNNIVYIDLNGIITSKFITEIINLSTPQTCIGHIESTNNNATFGGYMSNFKMFVGTSEIPKTYHDKRILDIDFKPTRESYLFKDNNNKLVIHPMNITQRNYLNSKYCCTFNGTDQYLQLGKNESLNCGLDDFVINIKFEINSFTNTFSRLLSNLVDVSSVAATTYIMVTGNDYSLADKRNKIFFGLNDSTNDYVFSNKVIELDTIYDLKIVRKDGVIDIFIDDQFDVSLTSSLPCNFNQGDMTLIGTAYASNTTTQARTRFKGSIYTVKILRNTSDVTLLEDVWVDPFPEPEVPPFEEGVMNFTELLKDIDPNNVVLDFKQLRYP